MSLLERTNVRRLEVLGENFDHNASAQLQANKHVLSDAKELAHRVNQVVIGIVFKLNVLATWSLT